MVLEHPRPYGSHPEVIIIQDLGIDFDLLGLLFWSYGSVRRPGLVRCLCTLFSDVRRRSFLGGVGKVGPHCLFVCASCSSHCIKGGRSELT